MKMKESSVHDDIKGFAEAIAQKDMCDDLLITQRQRWGPFIRNPLPLDSSAEGCPNLFTQLLKSIGNGSDVLKKHWSK